jgi:hypothetical protein
MSEGHESLATRDGLTIREAAIILELRSQSVYNLLRDELLEGRKTDTGEWIVSRESVEHYRLRRILRCTSSRRALQRRVIDVAVEVVTPQSVGMLG